MTYYMSLYFFLFYWSIVDLQCCVSFRYIAKWFSYTFFCIFFFILDYYQICAIQLFLVQFSSVTQSCLTLCDPMNGSIPGLPGHHQLLASTQTHVRWVSDTIQPSHPLSSPLTPAFNLSQHQGLFQWVTSSYQVEKCWSLTISPSNEHSGLISFRMDWFDLLASPRVFSNSTARKHQFLNTSLWSSSRTHTWLLEEP